MCFSFLSRVRFKFVGIENQSRFHCTTHGTCVWKSSVIDNTRDQRRCLHRPNLCSMMDIKRFFRCSSFSLSSMCSLVNFFSFLNPHVYAVNLDPTQFSQSSARSKMFVVHEDFPEFVQCVLSQLHWSWVVFVFNPRSPWDLFLCFLRFHGFIILDIDLTGFPISSPGASSQNIFLEPLPLVPPEVCSADPLVHSTVNDGTILVQHSTRRRRKHRAKSGR